MEEVVTYTKFGNTNLNQRCCYLPERGIVIVANEMTSYPHVSDFGVVGNFRIIENKEELDRARKMYDSLRDSVSISHSMECAKIERDSLDIDKMIEFIEAYEGLNGVLKNIFGQHA